jgi:hypothetical protein
LRVKHISETAEFPHGREGGKDVESPERLKMRIRLLERRPQKPEHAFTALYMCGAVSFWITAVSLAIWWLADIASPLHPIFASLVIPASVGVMGMAFLVRRGKEGKPHTKKEEN